MVFFKTVNQLCWTGQDDHCQFFLYQILRGMKYVHSAQARLMVSTAPMFVGKLKQWEVVKGCVNDFFDAIFFVERKMCFLIQQGLWLAAADSW